MRRYEFDSGTQQWVPIRSGDYRSLISIGDLGTNDIEAIVRRSLQLAGERTLARGTLSSRTVGLLFGLTSTRTRTSFGLGAQMLGANTIVYGPDDLQLNTGESLADTMSVLGGFLDLLVVRDRLTSEDLRKTADKAGIAVVNAMSFDEHPTQALSDLAVIHRVCGRIAGTNVCYLGEGNSTAAALALALATCPGAMLFLGTPAEYGLSDETRRRVAELSRRSGATIVEEHDVDRIPANTMDVIYTTQWQTTGTSKKDVEWRRKFEPFRVTEALVQRLARDRKTIFMHDLPAHRGEEVVKEIIDGQRSVVFLQAQQKLFTGMAVLEWCLGVSPD